jgi:hypothetical protein
MTPTALNFRSMLGPNPDWALRARWLNAYECARSGVRMRRLAGQSKILSGKRQAR